VEVKVTACDVCAEQPARKVLIQEGRMKFEVDLCDKHYDVIDQLRNVGRAPGSNRQYRRYRKVQNVEDRPTKKGPQEA
jgi:hypothetical protein